MSSEADKVRVDKWLWAARFFKTRSLAGQAVSGGRVRVNGQRAKSARALKTGDELRISKGETEFDVLVLSLAERRGAASVAAGLYRETESSVARREAECEGCRLLTPGLLLPDTHRERVPGLQPRGRPRPGILRPL